MSITNGFSFAATENGGSLGSFSAVITGATSLRDQRTVAASTTDQLFGAAFDRTKLKALLVSVVDASGQGQAVDLSLQTNNATTPIDTLSVKHDGPIIWFKNGPLANPFTANVTAIYYTLGATPAAGAVVTFVAILDP